MCPMFGLPGTFEQHSCSRHITPWTRKNEAVQYDLLLVKPHQFLTITTFFLPQQVPLCLLSSDQPLAKAISSATDTQQPSSLWNQISLNFSYVFGVWRESNLGESRHPKKHYRKRTRGKCHQGPQNWRKWDSRPAEPLLHVSAYMLTPVTNDT